MGFLRISVKAKIFLLIFCIFITAYILISQVITNTEYMLENMNSQKNDFYQLNTLQKDFARLESSIDFLLYYTSNQNERQEAWNAVLQVQEDLEGNLDKLNYSWSAENQEIYFLNRAIRQCYSVYKEDATKLVRVVVEDAEDNIRYEHDLRLAQIAEYAQMYIRESLSISISNEQAYLDSEVDNLARVSREVWVILGGFIFLVSFLMLLLTNSILNPILAITTNAIEIANGNFNIKDIKVSSNDEIEQLANSFNKMKSSMAQMIESLKEKSKIEKELYRSRLQVAQEQKLLEEARFKQLSSQINPHFLFNTLNIISRQARAEKSPSTEKLILILARIFRYSIKDDNLQNTLEEEIKIINDYMDIQYARFDKRIVLKWDIQPYTPVETIYLPTFTLQPLVENAIIHGLEHFTENGIITISIYGEDSLNILVKDNGIGMPSHIIDNLNININGKSATKGIGLGNVYTRLKLMYPNSSFTITSTENKGSTIHISIPFID